MGDKKVLNRLSAVFIFILFGSSAVVAQTSSVNYGFVSPNTMENLQLKDAIRGMYSAEESQLQKRANGMSCVIKRPINTARALGSWSDGAEQSLLLRVNTDETTMRYLMSRLGRDANQKAVLYFHTQRDGRAAMYVIHPAKRLRSLSKIGQLLDASGVTFRTLVPTKQETTVYVVDTENNLGSKVRVATKRLRGRLTSQTGNASFIGDDSVREKGQNVFQQEIQQFETRNPNLPGVCKNN